MTALIVCVYYDRPNMIRNAIESIRRQTSDQWHLAFIDDGSGVPGAPIVGEMLHDRLEQVSFYRCDDSVEDKRKQGGSRHGEYMTLAVNDCPGDVVIVLCDDDALHPECVASVCSWFMNSEHGYGYGHVNEFDPTTEEPWSCTKGSALNDHTETISPSCHVDSTQVVYRAQAIRELGCAYPFPLTGALDAAMFEQLEEVYGKCPFMGFATQFKGVWGGQLGKIPDLLAKPADMEAA